MYHDNVIKSQSDVLLRFENEENDEERRLDELESAAIATAIASSEYDQEIERDRQRQEESEKIAARLQPEEVSAADQDLASAFEKSETEALEEASKSLAKSALGLKRSRQEERHKGAWDCTTCTFTNQPYRQQCAMCQSDAPTNVLVFCELAPFRFGLEVEIIIPQGQLDGYTLETIATNVTNMGPRVEFMGYTHETSAHWKIVTDSSLRGETDDLCFELVSPVLQGEEGLGQFRAVMENVRKLGSATNASCGFDVHVDATHSRDTTTGMGTLAGLKRVAQCFVALENAFDLLVALTWENDDTRSNRRANRNRYCRSNRLVFGAMSNRQRWDKIGSASNVYQLVRMMNPNFDRYMKLNLRNITKTSRPSTCEFRHHGGVEELIEAEAWVRFVLRFCQRASQLVPSSGACLLREGSLPEEELTALFELVGCSGLEQFYVVERKLFPKPRCLRNAWTCRKCRRNFVSSRALSQHVAATGHS